MITKGLNKANVNELQTWKQYSKLYSEIEAKPCVFLSHKSEDKPFVRIIAEYFKQAGIDIFFDEEDPKLQIAVSENNPHKITDRIKQGIRESSHMLCIVSAKTITSTWVPFEIGYAQSAIIDKISTNTLNSKLKLSILIFKDLKLEDLPQYMQVGFIIPGTKSLNTFISTISNRIETKMLSEQLIKAHTMQNHPLDNILNYNL